MKQKFLLFCSRMMLLMALVCLPQVVLADELTVNDGTTTSSYVPIYGSWVDSYTRTQFVISAADLAEMGSGAVVNSLKFYSSTSSMSWGNATFEVRLFDVASGTTLGSSYQSFGSAAANYAGAVSISSNEMLITLSTPYTYGGEDIVVDFSQTAKGSYQSAYFYGKSGAGRYGYSGNGAASASGYSTSFAPKVTIDYTSGTPATCPKVGKPIVSGLAEDSARITWAKGGAETEWLVKLGNADYVTVSDTTCLFTGLDAATSYSYEVRALCGVGDTAKAVTGSFKTLCSTITSLSEGFAASTTMPDCWKLYTYSSSYSTYPYISSSSYATPNSLYFYGGTSYSFEMVVLPPLNASVDLSTMRLKFAYMNYYTSSYYGNFVVGSMSDAEDKTTFHPLDTLERLSDWTDYELALDGVPAGDRYLAIAFTNGSSWGSAYLDDIEISAIPTCRPSKDLKFVGSELVGEGSSATANASFSWTPVNGATEWQLKYKMASDTAYTVANVTSLPFVLENLPLGTWFSGSYILHSVCEGVLSPDSVKGSLSFGTACAQIVADTVRFDAEGMTTLTPCYDTYISKGDKTSKWGLSTPAHSGSKSYYLYGYEYSNSAAVLALPEFSLGEGQQLTFWSKEGTHAAADSLIVRLVLGEDTTVVYRAATLSADWQEHRVDLSEYRGENARLLFEGFNYKSIYLDDIVIAPKPNCQPISGLEFVSVAQTEEAETFEAKFKWVAGGEEAEWGYAYRVKVDTTGAVFEDWVEDAADSLAFFAYDLEANTQYVIEVKVKAVCDGGNESSEVVGSFRINTPCLPISLGGWSEGFEDYATGSSSVAPYAGCFDFLNVNEGAYPYAYVNNNSNYVHGDTKSLYFQSSSSKYAYAILPAFVEDVRDYRLKFWYKDENASNSGKLWVGYMTDIENEATFVALEEVTRTTTFTQAVVSLAAIPAELENARVAFKYGGASQNYYLGIDDISLEALPSCIAVTNLKVDSIGTTAARIAWKPGKNETEWSVQIKKGTTVILKDTISDPFVLIDTLQVAKTYTFKVLVKAVCDGAEATEFLPEQTLTFTTECEAVTAFPWSENFDAASSGDFLKTCFVNEHIAGSSTYLFKVSTSSMGSNSTHMLYLTDQQAGNITRLKLPNMVLPESGAYEFKFDIYRTNYSSLKENEGIKVVINGDTLAHAKRQYSLAGLNVPAENAAGWYTYVLDIPQNGPLSIELLGISEYGQATYVDNLLVRQKPLCDGASAIHVIDSVKTFTSATVAWSGTADAGYDVLLYNATDTIAAHATDTFYVVNNLLPSHEYTYNVRVVGVCAAGAAVDTIVAMNLHFATECQSLSIPYAEGFENSQSGSGKLPACWSRLGSNTSYPQVYNSSSYASEGSQLLYFYGGTTAQYAVTPKFDESISLSGVRIAFDYRSSVSYSSGYYYSYDYGYLVLGAMSDPENVATFVPLDTLEQSSSYLNFDQSGLAIPDSCHYLAFAYMLGDDDGYGFVDNIRVTEIPTCFPGTKLHAIDSLKTMSSVSFGWTPNDTANLNAHVVVKNGNVVLADSIVNDTIFTVNGLQSSTGYSLAITINTKCDGGIESTDALSGTLSLQTECGPIATLPWNEGFENAETSEMPLCWSKISTSTYPYVYSSSYYSKTGDKSMYAYAGSSTYGETYIVLPEISFAAKQALLKFYYKQGSIGANYNATIEVGVMSNPADAATFVAVSTLENVSTYTLAEVGFAAAPDSCHYMAIRVKGDASYSTNYCFDDFSMVPAPTCLKPSNLVQFGEATENSATFSWTAGDEETQWLVKRYNSANVLEDSVLVSSASYSINSLSANTKYTFTLSVQAYCSEEDQSEVLVKSFTFRTPMPADATEVMDKTMNREFNADFSSADEQAKWQILGEGANQFMFGTATAALLNEATAALYVSKNDSLYEYNESSTSASVAARQIEFSEAVDSLLIEFDWMANGESNYDYGRAFLVPDSLSLDITTAAKINSTTVAPGSSYYSNVPAGGAIDLGNGKMNKVTSAQSVNKKLENVAAGTYKLVFVWGNDSSTGDQSPLSICNVSVTILDPFVPTGMENNAEAEKAQKIFYNGKVYILRGGKIFSIMGHSIDHID